MESDRDKTLQVMARALEQLKVDRMNMADWAGYASEYFRDKHDIAGDLAGIDATVEDLELHLTHLQANSKPVVKEDSE